MNPSDAIDRTYAAVENLPKPYYDDGKGRLVYCGDCRELLPLIQKESIDLVLTDPMYSVSGSGVHVGQPGMGSRRMDFFGDADMDWERSTTLAVGACAFCFDKVTPTASFYVWCGHRQFGRLISLFERRQYKTRFLVWSKKCPPPPPPGTGWPSGAELCVFAYPSGFMWTHRGRSVPRSNVLISDNYRHGQPGKVKHPTQKPFAVIVPLVMASSCDGNIILDPFLGSGTTLRAAKNLGRCGIGIEIEPKYCEIAKERLRQEVLF